MSTVSVEVAHATNALLGEGVCWDSNGHRLLWVDIHGMRIHALHLDTGQHSSWPTPQRIGWLIPTSGSRDEWLAGFQEGFALVSLNSNDSIEWHWVNQVFKNQPHMRLNDAKADRAGKVWAGSLCNDDESKPLGSLMHLDGADALTTMDEGYCVCNGPAISPDDQLLLHTDSARRVVYAFDKQGSELTNKRVWRVFNPDEGYPDGMTFDASGNVWVAHWGGACISCFSRDGKQLVQRFSIPALNVTNICFGGPGLDRMFVTSARVGMTADQLQQWPLSGSVFEVSGCAARGLRAHTYMP